jgi:hypothetical protein
MTDKDTTNRIRKHNNMLKQGIAILEAHKGRQKDKIKSSERDIEVYSKGKGEVCEARVTVGFADIHLRQLYSGVTDDLIAFLEEAIK